MEKFTTVTGQAAFLPIDNIDTDMIIPKQYLKTIKRSGLGRWLFAAMRYEADGTPKTDFPLNAKPEAKILLAGKNFGCGSSREHAPWSLTDFGIRAIIAEGFADIFYNNSFKNALLPIRLGKEAIASLADAHSPITIDLENQAITCGNLSYDFEIEPSHKEVLLKGLDNIGRVLMMSEDIKTYESKHFARQPWLKAATQGA